MIRSLSTGQRYMILAGLCIALVNVGVKSLSHLPTAQIVLFRVLVPCLAGLVYVKYIGVSPWRTRKARLLLRGVSSTAALVLYYMTIQQMPIAEAVTLQNVAPVFSLLLARLVFRAPSSRKLWCSYLFA